MKLTDYKSIHIIGCGGAGCAPLAKILFQRGFRVTGSDLISNANTQDLAMQGIPISIGQDPNNIPKDESLLVIRTSAADENNPERHYAEQHGIPVVLRGQALAMLAETYQYPIAVSGSHGKTSVTSMIAWCLHKMGKNPGIMIGGNISGWEYNGSCGNGNFFVTEADESDSTNALLHPALGIVTNLEDDHAWSVGGITALENSFTRFASQSHQLIYGDSPVTNRLFRSHPNAKAFNTEIIPDDVPVSFPHFVRIDMNFALLALQEVGFSRGEVLPILCDFPGVDRRLSIRNTYPIPVIEDYAHHPTELRESIRAMRELYPGKRLNVIFQPHRYARLERYFHEFVQELGKADRVFITPVFAAWTGNGVYSSADLAKAVNGISLSGSWDEMGCNVSKNIHEGDVIVVIGAGDLPKILPSLIENIKSKC